MATQINGSQIQTDGNLQFSTTDGVVATHYTDGTVTTPQRPWFKYSSQNTGNPWDQYNQQFSGTNNGGDGQVGNCFDTSNGRFTAPRTGLYHFNLSHITTGNNGDTRIACYVNGAYHFRRSIVVHTNGPHHNNANQGHTCYLAEGDYVQAADHSGGNSHQGTWNCLNGYYVGEYS